MISIRRRGGRRTEAPQRNSTFRSSWRTRVTGAHLLVATAAAAAAVGAATVSVPVMSSALDRANESDQEAAALETRADAIVASSQDKKTEARLRSLRAALPDDTDLGGLLEALQAAASATGATWVASTQHATQPEDTATVSRLDVTVEATPSQLDDYIAEIRDLDRTVVVGSVTYENSRAVLSLAAYSTDETNGDS